MTDLPEGFRDTPLGPLPEMWEVIPLEDLATQRRETVNPQDVPELLYVGLEHIDPGDTKLKRWGNPSQVRSAKSRFYPDDVLYGKLRPYLDKAALSESEGICSTDIIVLTATDKAVPSFLSYLMHARAVLDHAIATTTGVNHPRTSWRALSRLEIPFPSLPEQHVIAHVLRTVQQAREATERITETARELKRSLMRHLFTYGPVPVAQADRVELQETEIGLVPAHWRVTPIEKSCAVKGGKRLPKGHSFSEEPTPFPYIRVTDFSGWSVRLTELKYLTPDDRETLQRYVITTSDVYISIAGTIGVVGTVPEQLDGANLTENAARIIINDKERLSNRYLVAYLASDKGQNQIDQRTTKTSQPKLALTRIRQMPFALPPIDEQHRMNLVLTAVDAKIAAEEARRSALDDLFHTLLHHLMTAKVRVPVSN